MYTWIIIDGYNLLHRQPGRGDIESRRHRLLESLARDAAAMAPRVTVVFDGRAPAASRRPHAHGLEVIYSPAGRTADEIIERLAGGAARPETVLVVTSDRTETITAAASGAGTMSCRAFMEQLAAGSARTSDRIARLTARGPGGARLGDFFPPN